MDDGLLEAGIYSFIYCNNPYKAFRLHQFMPVCRWIWTTTVSRRHSRAGPSRTIRRDSTAGDKPIGKDCRGRLIDGPLSRPGRLRYSLAVAVLGQTRPTMAEALGAAAAAAAVWRGLAVE